MFSDLLITRDKQTNMFIGGGYTLNSSFLNAGIPPLLQTGGKKLKSRSRARSPTSDADVAHADTDNAGTMKVSSLLERNTGSLNTLVIPAGLFMIHPDIALKNRKNDGDDADDGSASTHNAQPSSSLAKNIERFLYDGPEVVPSSNDVVPSDLYERLFSMLSPSQSEAKQYWHPKAATRSNHGKVTGPGKTRVTRRINPRK
jgi:hypothetical protein